jgi:membrane dipeptidase
MQIVDAHLDIAYNAIKYGRDPLLSVQQLREQEKPDAFRGTATVSFPALREAGAVIIFGTVFTFPERAAALMGGGDTTLTYRDVRQAHQMAMDQLDYYHRLADVEQNRVRLVTDLASLEEVTGAQPDDGDPLLGIVPLMEGAEPIREPAELELWVEKGLRAVGPAWDDTRYAAGSWRGSRYGLTRDGMQLLEAMASYQLLLDLTHMNEVAALEALDRYDGPLMASHSNVRALVPGQRQLSDVLIRRIGEHNGVIGIALYNAFLRANHHKGDPKQLVTLDHVLAHVDHICQLLGDAQHVSLGTDMDGGFGAEDIPSPLDSTADLPLLAGRMRDYGYGDEDVSSIMGGNWLRLLRDTFSV